MSPPIAHTDPLTLSIPSHKIKLLYYNLIGFLIFALFIITAAYFYFTDSPEFTFILMGGGYIWFNICVPHL